jgi:hypothetical protein
VDLTAVGGQPRFVPHFSLHVTQGKFSNAGVEAVFENGAAARKEAISICAALARDIVVDMPLDSEWRMEVADETGNPVFKFRILAETV